VIPVPVNCLLAVFKSPPLAQDSANGATFKVPDVELYQISPSNKLEGSVANDLMLNPLIPLYVAI